ncbi:MAG TPA: hypothetical protein VF824_16535 [Thermoanaerobaculia bacterium]
MTSRREFRDDDARLLEQFVRERRLRLALSIGAPVALLVMFVVTTLALHGQLAVVAGVAAIWPFMMLRPWRTVPMYFEHLRLLRRDGELREVVRCEGTRRDVVFTIDALERLTPEALAHGTPDEPLTVEALAVSGAILTLNTMPQRELSLLAQGTTAALPDRALAAARFLDLPEGAVLASAQRGLSADELQELAHHAPPLGRLHAAIVVLLAAVAAAAWWQAVVARAPTLALPVLATVVASIAVVRAARRLRLHHRFARDLAHGVVVMIRGTEDRERVVEVLPFSGLIWTDRGVTAEWRRLALQRRPLKLRRWR